MKRFFLIPNYSKPEAVEFIPEIKAFIKDNGGDVLVSEDKREGHHVSSDVPEGTEAVITLGGDGTIIQAAGELRDRDIPILGINMGHLGFLAEVEKPDYKSAVLSLLHDTFFVEERMMIEGQVLRNGVLLYENAGVNDIVLRAGQPKAIYFDMYVDGSLLVKYHADGMIISTPTGSTAYNLSAGGPIIMPSARMLLATPVNPHTLLSRSVVLPENVKIVLKPEPESFEGILLSFDGFCFNDLRAGDEILIARSDRKFRLIRLEKNSFIEVLRSKLEQ